jgi:AbrB family looped-hinge helix DNA binding protein
MTVTVKNKNRLMIPASVQRCARIKTGDRLEFKVSGGVITIVPELPAANDEYTPKQRRLIDARLAKSEAELKAGRSFGPFDTADDMIAHMKGQLKKRAAAKKTKRSR